MGVQKFKIKRKKLLQVDRTATVGCNKVMRHVNWQCWRAHVRANLIWY